MANKNYSPEGVSRSDAPLQTFTFKSLSVRTLIQNGEAWFIADDVCAALKADNFSQAVLGLNDRERGTFEITDSLGQQYGTTVVNESGLYALVNGHQAETEQFKQWVTHELLPVTRTAAKLSDQQNRSHDIHMEQSQQVVLRRNQHTIRSRDDLSFTRRDAKGRLINWIMPDRANNWHEHYGIGEIWFGEIVELAQHNPEEAYHAMCFACVDMLRYWSQGHPDGFFDTMARWALAAILTNITEPKLPFQLPSLGIPPREGMDFYLSASVSLPPIAPVQQKAIDKQAWREASECMRHCYERRRYRLMLRQE
ncbi:Bro-N domain-containing protein [Alcaligenes aquatilis]|uniref:Bro-N domain-containing protein n=1 Tax=Alcaligenes aquatilis TaxID=323284 RepID=A0A3G2HRF2_9BURK|nr:Bro-N domain-containing protein [Alcaligenes aquatilis]AYN19585.1 hypothetical protein D3M96_02960 [Alcaligenes aquatilis]